MSVWVDVSTVVTAAAAVAALSAGYVQFVLKRSVLPFAEFDVDFIPLYQTASRLFGEIDLIIKNQGSNMMIVTDVRCRVRWRSATDPDDPIEKDFMEPQFPSALPSARAGNTHASLAPEASMATSVPSPSTPSLPLPSTPSSPPSVGPPNASSSPRARGGWVSVLSPRTFVQPGVVQHYRKPIAIEGTPTLVHVWGAFNYRIELGRITKFLIGWLAAPPKDLDWRNGMENFTARRTFPCRPRDFGPWFND